MNQKTIVIVGLTIFAVLLVSILFPFWFYVAKITLVVAIVGYFAYILRRKFRKDASRDI